MSPMFALVVHSALAQDVPPALRLPKDQDTPAHISAIAGTTMLAIGVETAVSDRRIEAVGLRGGVGPALNLTASVDIDQTAGDLIFATFVAPYVRFGRSRLHVDGYVGPAVLLSGRARLAFVSGAAFESDLSPHISVRVGGASYVSLATAIPAMGAADVGTQIGLAPELGVSLRW